MSNPLLSIIIPTYNRPHLLPRAVNTALGQTLENVEVTVVDDASNWHGKHLASKTMLQ